jgi:hypothetical protein
MKRLVLPGVLLIFGAGSCVLVASWDRVREIYRRFRDFTLLDVFDSLDTSKLTFVKVATGEWVRHDDEPPRNTYRFGFLLKDEPGMFTVRYVDLTRSTLRSTAAGTPEHERVGYEAVEIAAHVLEFIRNMADERFYVRPDSTMEPRGVALLLARACARRGLKSEMEALLEAAGEKAMEDVAEGLARQLAIEIADPGFNREQLLARHRQWLDAFPENSHRKWVQWTAYILGRMLGQKMPEGEIDGLIFSLRDEFAPIEASRVNGWELTPPEDRLPGRPRPWEKLETLGYAAVPALIEAVDDEELTRCVRYSSRYGGSFSIHDVGLFAEMILDRITGIRFWGETEERVAQWRAWWKTVSEKGEDEAMAEVAATGGSSSELASKRLLERRPDRVDAVLRGVGRATNRAYRRGLAKIVSGVRSATVDAFLLEELEKAPYAEARVDAAQALLDRGDRHGLDVCLQEWRDAMSSRETTFDEAQAMAGFLLASGDLDAVRAVSDGLVKHPVRVRLAVFESLGEAELKGLLQRAKPEGRTDIERELERILGLLMDETHRQYGSFSFRHGADHVTLTDPLLADRAACQLQEFWPAVYPYDPKGPTRIRERRLIDVKNVFRNRFGLDPIAAPALPDVRSRDPLIPKAVQALDLPRLEAAGLGALPWIEDRLKERPQGDLAELARELSNIVHKASLETGTWEAPRDLREMIAGMEGKALNPREVVGLVILSLGALPSKQGDIELRADRLGDGTGTTLTLRVMPGAGRGGESVDSHLSVEADGRTLMGSDGTGFRSIYGTPARYEDMRKAIEKALGTSHAGTFEIRIELEVGRVTSS